MPVASTASFRRLACLRPWTTAAFTLTICSIVPLAAACSPGANVSGSHQVSVVAATDVWGDIAATVGGRWVSVTSIISNPAQDPHSYQASARVLLDIKEADLLIENGGGYDDFMGQMISASGTRAPVLDAVTISGHTAPPGGDLNEHVWYDLATAKRVAGAVASQLTRLQPSHAAQFKANATAFDHRVEGLIGREQQIKNTDAGTPVSITEPVPLYMLDAMGLVNKTPPAFSRAVEESIDVSARVLAQTLNLYSQHQVAALVYNEQTTGPITEQVENAATAAGIPTVPVTETLPPGLSYLTWMSHNITNIAHALQQ